MGQLPDSDANIQRLSSALAGSIDPPKWDRAFEEVLAALMSGNCEL
jgi:hypothetical protein